MILPDEVYIRHECECDTAVVPPGGHGTVHIFTVDGEDFPWHISERGPVIRRLAEELYGVYVELLVTKDEKKGGFYQGDYWQQPKIGGIEFPWVISDRGLCYAARRAHLPVVMVEFYARHVDANIPIADERPEYDDRDINSLEGSTYQQGIETRQFMEALRRGGNMTDECGVARP